MSLVSVCAKFQLSSSSRSARVLGGGWVGAGFYEINANLKLKLELSLAINKGAINIIASHSPDNNTLNATLLLVLINGSVNFYEKQL